MRSLQARMFLVFALIATIPLLAMSYLALNATREALQGEVGRANGDAAKAAAGFVDVYVENARGLLDAEARSPTLREAIVVDDRASQLLVVQGLRERASYEGTRIFRGIALFDANGTLLVVWPAETADAMDDPLHAAAVDVTLRAEQQQQPTVFPVPRAGEPVLPIAAPVLVNGAVRGVILGDVSLAGLSAGLEPFAAPDRTVFLTDRDGRVLVHPDEDLLAERRDLSDLKPVSSARERREGFVEYEDPVTGETALGSFATITRLNWIIVNSVPTSVAYGALQQLTGVLIGLSGLLVGAILLASIAVARRIVAPVQELTEASRALAQGKLGRRLKPGGDDEIGELARAFNQMADRIAESLEGIRRSESRYRSLVESASDLIFTVQPDGELSFASPQMRRVLGEGIVRAGAPASELVHPEDRAAFRAAIDRVLAYGEPALWLPFRLMPHEGPPRAVVTNFTPVYEGGEKPARVLAVAHDVTEERRQEALREKAFQMARLVSEETGIDALAHRGLLLMLSAGPLVRGAVYLVRGGQLRESARVNVRDAARFSDLAAKARSSGTSVAEEIGGEGALAVPLVEHGEALGAVVLAGEGRAVEAERDVLAALSSQLAVGLRRSLFEARLKDHAAELETRVVERTRELTQKSEEMEQFLYSVSHDLKAPLISIQGYAQGLEEDYAQLLQGEGAQYLERIRKNATLMESLILDLLELSRIGRTRGEVEHVDMEKLFTDIAGRMAGRFSAASGELHVDRPLPGLDAEPKRLSQLFTNLVDNALKYRHAERAPIVRVWADEAAEEVVYHVRDNGRGIPARYADQVFKIFQRVPTPGMEDPGGTGMGLAIVRRIAETQGGRVWFDSVEGEGTTFHVALPKRRSPG